MPRYARYLGTMQVRSNWWNRVNSLDRVITRIFTVTPIQAERLRSRSGSEYEEFIIESGSFVKPYAPIFQYWENRYRKGGTSGAGSTGEYRKWKWGIIESYVGNVDDVLDVGCGDLSFWEGRDCPKYLGLDISPTIIEKDRQLRPS